MTSRPRSLLPAGALCGALAGALTGCLDHELAPDDEGGDLTTFIALQRDFQGFTDWERFYVGDAPTVDTTHITGPRYVYANRLLEEGDAEFPVGTILVKTVETGGVIGEQILAMVKRGGAFNEAGAVSWEWFELGPSGDGQFVIVWRGEEPPSGHSYGCLQGECDEGAGDCNGCHGAAQERDYVMAEPLDFSELFLAAQDHGSNP